MPCHHNGPDRITEYERRRQLAREALHRQVGIWLSGTIPVRPQHLPQTAIRSEF